MSDVASDLKNWSSTSGSGPSGTTAIGTGLDDNIRELAKVVRQDLASIGSDIASAATTDLGAYPGLVHSITGTATISSFGTVSAGIWKMLRFSGACTIVSGSPIEVPGGANLTTAAGDSAIVYSKGSGNWAIVSYQPAASVGDMPPGTRCLFQQTTAPVGWTKDTSSTYNDAGLRIVTGTASSGGSVAFSTIFARTATDAYTLQAADIPSHTHPFSGTTGGNSVDHSHSVNDPGHLHGLDNGAASLTTASGAAVNVNSPSYANTVASAGIASNYTGITIGGASTTHTHNISGTTSATGGGGGHQHALDLRLKYADVIICTRN